MSVLPYGRPKGIKATFIFKFTFFKLDSAYFLG